MTYTFKLSRRLAVSRDLSVLAVAVFLTACAGDTTGPESPSNAASSPLAFRVVPGAVTVQTNQPIRFRGESPSGDLFVSPLSWQASGGTIELDGTFTATEPGTYKVIGRGRGRQKPDTSTVVVVPPQPDLTGVELTPASVTVNAGESYAFTAIGKLADGSTAPVGVTWSATGGSIDPSGLFTAGQTTGAYRVIALHSEGLLADTSSVTVAAGAAPEPDPEPEPTPPPAPTLTEIVLKPASVSLTTGASKQFRSFGRTSAGDSVAVTVSYSATGGVITAAGLYTAGTSVGSYRVIAAAGGLADTAQLTLTAPIATTGTLAVPFGPFAAWDGASMKENTEVFSVGMGADAASGIINRIDGARRAGKKILLAMTGGHHDNYLTNGVFDRAKWNAKMQTFNTSAIRQAIAAGVADGTILGNSVMDEPHVANTDGDEDGGNTWGPPGTMTKAKVDDMCGYVKQIFPTLPVGAVHRHDMFEPSRNYAVCDFVVSQYSHRLGSVTAFRDGGLEFARRSGISIAFSINILNGGIQDRDGSWDCAGTGGLGTRGPNCRMTATQVRDFGLALGQAGCAMLMWRYDAAFMANSGNQTAFRTVADALAKLPRTRCARV